MFQEIEKIRERADEKQMVEESEESETAEELVEPVVVERPQVPSPEPEQTLVPR